MNRVLIAVNGEFESCLDKLGGAGIEVTQASLAPYKDADTFVKQVSGYDAVIMGGGNWNEEVLSKLKGKLSLLVKFGVGVDNIDLNAATKYGIAVANAPGSNSRAVAEHALALILTIVRDVVKFDKDIKSGLWETTKSGTIIGKTIGLLGFGNISMKLAEFLRGLPVNTIAYDIYKNEEKAKQLGVKYAELDELISSSDIISIHMPLLESTKGLVDKNFFKKMKSASYIINTSRGAIINENDMIYALKNGIIRGAALDTFEQEPLPVTSELLKLDNVVLTPHSASITDEAFASIMDCCVDNVIAFYTRGELKNVLNPEFKNNN